MSDNNPTTGGVQLPADAVKSLQDNLNQANDLLNAWDAIEKLGISIPGTKEQLQNVRDLTKALLDNFQTKSS